MLKFTTEKDLVAYLRRTNGDAGLPEVEDFERGQFVHAEGCERKEA
jgi:hypothetical protein